MSFGEKVSAEISKLGVTKAAFAERVGLLPSTLGNYLAGTREPPFETVVRIADALEVSTDYLFGRVNDEGVVIVQPAEPSESAPDKLTGAEFQDLVRQLVRHFRHVARERGTDDYSIEFLEKAIQIAKEGARDREAN